MEWQNRLQSKKREGDFLKTLHLPSVPLSAIRTQHHSVVPSTSRQLSVSQTPFRKPNCIAIYFRKYIYFIHKFVFQVSFQGCFILGNIVLACKHYFYYLRTPTHTLLSHTHTRALTHTHTHACKHAHTHTHTPPQGGLQALVQSNM